MRERLYNMKNTKTGISKETALKMFYYAGYNTEALLLRANNIITKINSNSGYYFSGDILSAIGFDVGNI